MTDTRSSPGSAGLLPCPFCGEPGEIVKNSFPRRNRWRHPTCTNPGCVAHVCEQDEQGGTLVDFKTDAEAIKLWNTRGVAQAAPETYRETVRQVAAAREERLKRLSTALLRIQSLDEKNVPKYAQQIACEALAMSSTSQVTPNE